MIRSTVALSLIYFSFTLPMDKDFIQITSSVPQCKLVILAERSLKAAISYWHYMVEPEEIADVEFEQTPLKHFYTATLFNGDTITCENPVRSYLEGNCTVRYQNRIIIPTNANFTIIKEAYEAKVRKQTSALINNQQAQQ